MANTIRIKRRATGSAGAPASLENAELAYNEVEDVLYYGKGTGGAGGTATTTPAIAGTGAFLALAGTQTVTGDKTFSGSVALGSSATASTKSNTDSSTSLATTAFVKSVRLDQLAAPTSSLDANSQRILNVAAPVADTDAANKAYVDAARSGLDVKASVKVIATSNISLSGTSTAIDGVSLTAGDRVLVAGQNTGAQNGIYEVKSGAWSRAADADEDAEVTAGLFTFVEKGDTYADSGWVLTTDGPITLGSTALSFTRFSGTGQITAGDGLTKTGNTIDIGTASTSRIVVNADTIDLATTGISADTYKSVTVDSYGRVTAGSNPTSLSGYGITDAQPLDATLTAYANASTGSNILHYFTGTDTVGTTTLTTYGRSLIDDTDAAGARTTLGLGTIATQDASNVTITGGSINGIILDGGSF